MSLLKQDRHFINLAFTVAEASRCQRATYGTVIVSKDGRVIATGRNGKPRGSVCDTICFREGLPPNSGQRSNCCIHSEANALMFSHPLDRMGGTMYVSGVPCEDCALLLLQAGLARIVFWDGPQASGHRGNSNEAFLARYGKADIEWVAYTHEAWEALHG